MGSTKTTLIRRTNLSNFVSEMMMFITPNIETLPWELIRFICGFLSKSDISSLEMTSFHLRRLISSSGVWRDVVLRQHEELKNFVSKPKECTIVEQMIKFLNQKQLEEARNYKIISSLIQETMIVLKVIEPAGFLLTATEESKAWENYLSVVRPLVTKAISEEKTTRPCSGKREISEFWFALNIPTAYLRNRMSWTTLYEKRYKQGGCRT